MSEKNIIANRQQLILTWDGKAEAARQAERPCRLTLEKVDSRAGDKGAANLIIEGDNLDAMKLLLPEYEGRLRLIYIDPPYNTGNAFVYRDSFDHAVWLNMMYPRLLLARRLLADNGAIFVSIDDNEVDKLKLLMSEIFSEENFLAQITVLSNPRGRQAERHFARVHEYLLAFAKEADRCNLSGAQLTEEQSQEFALTDETGRRYRLLGLRQRGADSLREDRPAMYYPIYVDPKTASISLSRSKRHSAEVLPCKSTGQPGRWMWGRKRTLESLALLQARLIRGRNEWDIFVRDYFDDDQGKSRRRKLKTIWDDKALNYQNGKRELKELLGKAVVDYPKPTALLRKLIDLIEEKDALFLDFFAGSGTLGQAVLEANADDGGRRRFILVQVPEPTEDPQFPTIADVCRSRVEKVVVKLNKTSSSSAAKAGFRYCRVI